MRRRQPPYTSYARHYDQIGQRHFGERSAEHALRLLAGIGFTPKSVLDLACGTGAATLEFARRGLAVTGLDISGAMLDRARATAADLQLDVAWIEADMTSFRPDASVDLCTCFYDAVNYLSNLTSVSGFARSAFSALREGGFLMFDINTRRKLRDHWAEMTIVAADDEDRYIVYHSWFDEAIDASPLVITGFERTESGLWTRFEEEHVETAFTITDIEDRLKEAGFESVQVFDWGEAVPGVFRPGTEESFRVLFLVRKPAGERVSE